MITFFGNKLARNNAIVSFEKKGITVDYYILDEQEYRKALANKLIEEAAEVHDAQNKDELLEEIADVQEVIDSLLRAHNITFEQLREAQENKRAEKGGFDKRIFIRTFSMDEDSAHKEKFLKQPEKYPLMQE